MTITPLTWSGLLDRIPGLDVAQIVQAAPTTLRVHVQPSVGSDPDGAWRKVSAELKELLSGHGLDVTLERASDPPRPSAGGKYRLVRPLAS